ncbi:LysM peptidoglycan-binding domain-containing protein [Aliigemmobacter aestuarii]|uniref:LysM peptidoglycan-binding domain-containing protein n=1 Tax=Aliigemmobacter aestuarii TaxID=1445661 RepID=A0A4S3MPD5_9RHOB|nr:peptidoglycan DD-metalloendopeptidase family protein [Gemmobacter aestuarii]THD84336.1 LysM peptidoglycan-binding domain-containing protein [Gemmobacter aestuarii]
MKTPQAHLIPAIGLGAALAALSACTSPNDFDWDFRPQAGLDTSAAARQATADRPDPDARGVISYSGYQVAVARRGDSVTSVAARVGIDAGELARFNALKPGDTLRAGEVLALPRRVAEAGPVTAAPGAIMGSGVTTQPIDVSSIATGAIDRASGSTPAATPRVIGSGGPDPVRHQVKRGETAFTIARAYNVTAKALADWNGLGADMMVREGQYLLIPVASGEAPKPATQAVTVPGQGSPTPEPPSAAKPLPAKDEPPSAQVKTTGGTTTTAAAPVPGTPASPDLGSERSGATASKFAMPVQGRIIRPYSKQTNGIDIAAAPGTPVVAAADGTVAAVTKDVSGLTVLILRHADGILTVYSDVPEVMVQKGASVKRGQTVAKVRSADPSFLHFEVRKGFDSTDPMPYLQ